MALNGGINQHDWDCIPMACLGLMNNGNMSEMLDKVSRPTKDSEEASQCQGGTGRQLEFEAAMACRDVATGNHCRNTEGINMDNSRSPFTPTSLESHISFLKEIGGHSSSVLQVSHGPSKILQLPLCANKTFQGCPGGNGIYLDSIGETVTTCSNAITDIKSSGYLKPHPVDIKPIKQCTTLIEDKISVSEDAQRIVDQHQMTFRKKRKPAMQNIENEGCKHCSCKKSKCLKLYCECFAAGVYCAADTCTCENCFNKEEYEDTVLDIRQQIESRNPLAFTPKIVKQVTQSSSSISDQGIHMAPSSARHKRGCYCKKSKCLKKYCECNQAKVGCSDGCRCEDCQNTFGPKPVCISAEEREGPPKEKLGSVDTGTYIVDNSQFPGNGVREMVSIEQELNCSQPSREDQSMPSWEVFADLNHFTPISDPPSEFSHWVSPNDMNLTKGPLSQGTNHHSSDGSLHCLSLPVSFTPQLCKTKDLSELGYYTPNEAICTSIPIEDENTVPLNLKGRPPQFYQGQEPMSSSLLAEKSACNFLLQPGPSFPDFILHGDPKKEQFNKK